jgi:hypothetical protein
MDKKVTQFACLGKIRLGEGIGKHCKDNFHNS